MTNFPKVGDVIVTPDGTEWVATYDEKDAIIAGLQERIAELEAALKPFADITEKTSAQWVGDLALYGASLHSIRAARAACRGEKD